MTPAEIAERVAELRVVVADHQRFGWGTFTTTTEKAAALLAACEENARLRADRDVLLEAAECVLLDCFDTNQWKAISNHLLGQMRDLQDTVRRIQKETDHA